MDIAILLAGLRFDSQQKMVSSILDDALQDGSNVYIFVCDVVTESTMGYNNGELQIFSLANFDLFDGVILHGDSIRKREVVEEISTRIKQADIPVVSFNSRQKDMLYVGLENFNGIYKIINHLIKVHGARTLNYVSGPILSIDAQDRLEAYKRALEENGILFEEDRVYYGDWCLESGERAVLELFEKGASLPDAIVAANDEMALGVFYALQEKGYNVPEHVLLTGYDNASIARYHYPRLTSVMRPEFELGQESYRMLKAQFEGKETVTAKEFMCEPIYAESCGCQEQHFDDITMLRRRYVKRKLQVSAYSDIIRFSAADFTAVESYDQLFEAIKEYTLKIKLGEFYICMCEDEQEIEDDISYKSGLSNVRTDYTDRMHIPLLYRDGKFSSHGYFDKQDLLPKEYTEGRNGNFYMMIPLHYQEYCYGYFVLCNSRVHVDNQLFHLFIININNALENIRQKRLLSKMIDRLNRMWVYDTLTGIYNRAGFGKFAPRVMEEARQNNTSAFIVFLDLDGLKKVNDQYGHDEGDKYIKAIVEVLSRVRRQGELLMRYGGDEFVVLAQGATEAAASDYVKKVYEGIDAYNKQSTEIFKLQASIGYTILDVSKDVDIYKAIEEADKEMYKIKKERKRNSEDNLK